MTYPSEDFNSEEYRVLLQAEARMQAPKRVGMVQEEPEANEEENPEE